MSFYPPVVQSSFFLSQCLRMPLNSFSSEVRLWILKSLHKHQGKEIIRTPSYECSHSTCSLNVALEGLSCPSSVYSCQLNCSHSSSWGNVGGWAAEVWSHLVRALAKCTQDMKQTHLLCVIDYIDLSRAVAHPRCTIVNCCAVVIYRRLCSREAFWCWETHRLCLCIFP